MSQTTTATINPGGPIIFDCGGPAPLECPQLPSGQRPFTCCGPYGSQVFGSIELCVTTGKFVASVAPSFLVLTANRREKMVLFDTPSRCIAIGVLMHSAGRANRHIYRNAFQS
ncbi:hypothetical protein M378DRAFT_200383 [Amanita muscaria Koide BX008]|uniref:Uncharacterized protein n=1 Tax=Amanita muscaria (strain Koide BX008) TaxID=946122 RepID=A0A0C2WQ32_AMAMK|nr:hypothetical protein M378DRAFT_200383 [Amanita muscaria Koide BX008]